MDNFGRSAIIGTGSNLLREESSGSEDGSHDIHSVQFHLGSSPLLVSPTVPSISPTASIPPRVTSATTVNSPTSTITTTTLATGSASTPAETEPFAIMSTNTTATMAGNILHGNQPYATNDR